MTMQAALSSVNCRLSSKPSDEKNAIDLSRSRTGRLRKIFLDVFAMIVSLASHSI